MCAPADQFERFHFQMLRTVSLNVWTCLFLIIGAYCYIYKHLGHGFDLAWLLIGLSVTWKKHPRKIIWSFLIGSTLLSLSYQSSISADSFVLLDVPFLETYIEKGIKLWIDFTRRESNMGFLTLREIFPKLIKEVEKEFLMGKISFEDLFYHSEVNITFPLKDSKLAKLFEHMAKESIAIPGTARHGSVLNIIRDDLLIVKSKYVCRAIKMSGLHKYWSIIYSLRTQGYLSKRAADLVTRYVESCMVCKVTRLFFSFNTTRNDITDVERAHMLGYKRIGLYSVVSVAGVFHVLLGLTLLILGGFGRLRLACTKVWSCIKEKSTISKHFNGTSETG